MIFRQLLEGGVRGKYAKGYHAGTNLVLLDPVRKVFHSERAANQALRLVIQLRKVGSAGSDRRSKAKSRESQPVA
jgi:hypothetical protein